MKSIYQLPITIRAGQKLSLIVESLGRICFGDQIRDSKGLVGDVTLGGVALHGWTQTPVHLKPCDGEMGACEGFEVGESVTPATPKGAMTWYAGSYNVTEPKDTFLRLDGWYKGYAWVNGFLLGRYWPVLGPQRTLYAPHGLFHEGRNMVMILELEDSPCSRQESCSVRFVDTPDIDGPVPAH